MMPEPVQDKKEFASEWCPSAVVGLGASAGGLGALRAFFAKADQADDSLAYVIVQHLDPNRESTLVELLEKSTALRVVEADDGQRIERGHVYVVPPGNCLHVRDQRLQLSDVNAEPSGVRMSVDALFRSMAEVYADRAVAVVLSGMGEDGSAGLRAIAAAGGICAGQLPATAEHDGMPSAAESTGVLHFSLPPEELRCAIIKAIEGPPQVESEEEVERGLAAILRSVKNARGSDFRHYKPSTILRRVRRRMGLLQVGCLADYAERVDQDAEELDQLSRDLLIGVTGFFRDPAVFQYIRQKIAPALVSGADHDRGLRVWVPGCSTGEEAYTLAMILLDEIRRREEDIPLQVFASDMDRRAIEYARRGHYPASIVVDIPGDLREQYMCDREDGTYEPITRLRESIVVAEQDLLRDPPFSRVDMVSCRNLLIYLKSDVQRKLMELFHFALNPGGILLLGTSESAGRENGRFEELDRGHRVYRRLGLDKGSLPGLPIRLGPGAPRGDRPAGRGPSDPGKPLAQRLQDWISRNLAPAAVVVNADHEVVYVSAQAYKFLRVPEGEPSTDLYAMLGRSAAIRIRAILGRVIRTGQAQPLRPIALSRAEDSEPDPFEAKVEVRPLDTSDHEVSLFVLIFREVSTKTSDKFKQIDESQVVEQLEQELHSTRDDLQTTIEEIEATNEELRASSEEAMSVNEELQSANEELETSKEELQSLNEELTTVNAQLRDKLEEVETVNNDINNLLASTDMGVLFLDTELRIKRFTSSVLDLYRLVPNDVGRSIEDINRRFQDPMLEENARKVLERLVRSEKQVRGESGRTYQQRMLPYKTHDNRIEGVVITYAEVTELQQTIAHLDRSLKQQAAFAKVGSAVVKEEDLQTIFDIAAREAQVAVEADFTKVLRMNDPESPMTIMSGLGWDPEIVANAPIGLGLQSQAGYTIRSDGPVVVSDLRAEGRFNGPPFLTEHGVRSGISCTIRAGSRIWGVLGIHSREVRHFSDQDIDFVRVMANLLGHAILLREARTWVREESQRLEFALESGDIGAWEYNHTTGEAGSNDRQKRLLGMGPREEYTGSTFWKRVHPEDRAALKELVDGSSSDRSGFRADFRIVLPSGEVRWLHGAGSVNENSRGELVMYGVNFDITQRKEAERLLELSMTQLEEEVVLRGQIAEQRLREIRRMNYEMVITESVERRRLAAELHDNLAQLLGLGLMKLGAIQQDGGGATPRQIQELREILQRANDTTRSVMAQLTPQVLDELGFGPAIEWLAEQTEQIYSLHVRVKRNAEPVGLDDISRLILFRAVRELLINVAKHAGVDEAVVTLGRGSFGYRVTVRDRGAGFDAKKIQRITERRYGLLGMRERISHVGGTVEIESAPGTGCMVTIEVPDPSLEEDERE